MVDFHFLGKSIAAGRRRKSTNFVFSNLSNMGQVLAVDWLIDTTVCYAASKPTSAF